ncbi:protein-L-isoaspartate O-methyltransferase family protein [Georgenia sp. Z1344]|uniref:protein-L-isoaspartate O-methyltransferase family protein n=1 Tax=Georgenia sp. Z1344 TaxID=3416706 RepID=UPI003CF364ED
MARVDRARFLPRATRPYASTDAPLTIGHGATCSQPSTVRAMLELLDVPAGARVLDVGSGSGWTTAILAELVGRGGSVLGVELVPELVRRSRAALEGAASVGQAAEDVETAAPHGRTGTGTGTDTDTDTEKPASPRTGRPRIEFRVAEAGVLGAPDDGPFDRILVSAMSDAVPEPLVAQLAVGGVMVVPAGGHLVRVRRTPDGRDEERAPGSYAFVPLR